MDHINKSTNDHRETPFDKSELMRKFPKMADAEVDYHKGYVYFSQYSSEKPKDWQDEETCDIYRTKADGSGKLEFFKRVETTSDPSGSSLSVTYKNFKDFLAGIMSEDGAEAVLGDLTPYFPIFSFQPFEYYAYINVSKYSMNKRIIHEVYGCGAAEILKNSLHASQADKEIAVQKAIEKLFERLKDIYGCKLTMEESGCVIGEFITALGWQIDVNAVSIQK